MINNITYHVGNHTVEASIRHLPEDSNGPEISVISIKFLSGTSEVSEINFFVKGNIEQAKEKLAAIKAVL